MTCFKGVVMETFSREQGDFSRKTFIYLFLKEREINSKNKFIYSRSGLKCFYSDFPNCRTQKYIQVVTLRHMSVPEKFHKEPQSSPTPYQPNTLHRCPESPVASKNMKSCGTTQRNIKLKNMKKVMGIYWWKNECLMSYLTIRKHAPSRTAFILTSKSMGKLMPKLSVSVSDSLIRPVHCLLIRPTGCPSLPVTCTRGQTKAHNLWSFCFNCKKLNMKINTKQL